MDPLDDIVRDAMKGLEATTPRDYFDTLPGRVEARIDAAPDDLEGSMPGLTNDDARSESLDGVTPESSAPVFF